MAEDMMNWDDCLQHAVVTDIGMRRSNNQDASAVRIAINERVWRERGHLFVVADGMGAHQAGELASELTVQGIPHCYYKYQEISAPEALQKSILETNAEVHRRGQANTDFFNMGTTASVLVLLPQGALVAHVGDSRVYRLRGNRLDQITSDHSLVWELREQGQLSENDALVHAVPKNVITRSLGPNATVQVDMEGPFPIEQGDTFLLCSDGLTGQVKDEEIGPILANLDPEEAARALVDLANLRGGPDNTTVIVAKVTGSKLATQVSDAAPITIGVSRDPKVHVGLWLVASVFVLAAAGLGLAGHFLVAVLAGGGGLLIVAVGLWLQFLRGNGGVSLTEGRRLGKGPYVKVACPAIKEFVASLREIVEEIREAALQRHLSIDWAPFDDFCDDAETLAKSGDYSQSLRNYTRGMRFMMQQFRRERESLS